MVVTYSFVVKFDYIFNIFIFVWNYIYNLKVYLSPLLLILPKSIKYYLMKRTLVRTWYIIINNLENDVYVP
jgi:hypothetical protein